MKIQIAKGETKYNYDLHKDEATALPLQMGSCLLYTSPHHVGYADLKQDIQRIKNKLAQSKKSVFPAK